MRRSRCGQLSTEQNPELGVSVTDVVVRAAALALRKVPQANSTWAESGIRVYDTADIAVAVNTPSGLITPIVREADRKDLGTISQELKVLTSRARAGDLKTQRIHGWDVHDLEPRHVRRREFVRDRESAPELHSWGWCRDQTPCRHR